MYGTVLTGAGFNEKKIMCWFEVAPLIIEELHF